MPLSTAAKVALCVCPPALMAGTVATVPAAKRAVHHATAPRHAPRPIRRLAVDRSVAPIQRQEDCAPGLGGVLPEVPLVTYASPIADEPGGGFVPGNGAPPVPGAIGLVPGSGGNPDTPTTPTPPVIGPVPEPSVWLMMIVGVGTLGATLRRRRRNRPTDVIRLGPTASWSARKATIGGALWSGSAAVEAGDMAATVAMKSAVASAAGKALLCVCPAAIVAGTVMTVPPLRQAVHASTVMPEAATPVPVAVRTPLPCAEPLTVPVAASSVEGFPALVQTIPASASASAPASASAAAPVAATAMAKTAASAG